MDYLVIDLEATCDDAGGVPRQEMEIIEIGAVLVAGADFRRLEEFQTFVRPVRNPILTPFCTALTSITQSMIAAAPGFADAMAALTEFIAGRQILFCSWGAYDNNQFENDARHHGVALPFGGRHLNLKAAFSTRRGTRKRFGMAAALRAVGLPLQGTHHRGIDDARNIAALVPYCIHGHRA